MTKVEPHQVTVRMDGKDERVLTFDPREMRHFDHGYAVTSHSSQGLTTGRIIANMDGETARSLVNTRLAYVAISRASEDAVFTRMTRGPSANGLRPRSPRPPPWTSVP